MRSRRISALSEVAVALAVLATGSEARAEETTSRIRIDAGGLPRVGAEGWKIDPKLAVLPSGAREGGMVPASWPTTNDDGTNEHSRCVDDRRGDVQPVYGGTTYTTRIFESGGKEYLDHVTLDVKNGVVHVAEAFRTPIARVADGIWAYRTKDDVMLVAAVDEGVFDRAVFYGCSIRQFSVASPAGATMIESSASQADEVMRQMRGDQKHRLPPWVGTEMRVVASVSRSSADPGPMLRLVITRGRASSP